MQLVDCQNISLSKNGRAILNNVSLRISKGEFITVIGPNGAGKSMLLKTLIGIEQPTSGNIKKVPELKIGYVPQKITIDASMPLKSIDFLKMVNGANIEDINRIIIEVGAETTINRQLNEVSGGELQRIMLARALLHKPNLLILDEPALNLDISGQLAFYQLLSKIHKTQNMAILMVSHDLHMVMATTNKVICLFHHICCSGTPDVITQEPEFIKLFGKDFSDMMAVYHHHHNHNHLHEHTHDGEPCNHEH